MSEGDHTIARRQHQIRKQNLANNKLTSAAVMPAPDGSAEGVCFWGTGNSGGFVTPGDAAAAEGLAAGKVNPAPLAAAAAPAST